jgi:hypothetical protein
MVGDVNIGDIFGNLTVLQKSSRGWARWICACKCGVQVCLAANKLCSGNNKSCGCEKRSVLGASTRTHGQSNSRITGYTNRTYGIWQAMRDRCSNPNRADWLRYGGAGIKVCDRWDTSYEAFLQDMGSAPVKKSIDRIDGTKGYNPDNCRWATAHEQAVNSSRSIVHEINGIRDSISGWARRWGVSRWRAKKHFETAKIPQQTN